MKIRSHFIVNYCWKPNHSKWFTLPTSFNCNSFKNILKNIYNIVHLYFLYTNSPTTEQWILASLSPVSLKKWYTALPVTGLYTKQCIWLSFTWLNSCLLSTHCGLMRKIKLHWTAEKVRQSGQDNFSWLHLTLLSTQLLQVYLYITLSLVSASSVSTLSCLSWNSNFIHME